MNGLVGETFRLHNYRDPTGRFDGAERIKIAVPLEVPALALADLIDQNPPFGRSRFGVRLKISGKKRGAVLIEHLEKKPIGKLDCRQAPTDSFHEDRDSNITEDRPVWPANHADDIGYEPFI